MELSTEDSTCASVRIHFPLFRAIKVASREIMNIGFDLFAGPEFGGLDLGGGFTLWGLGVLAWWGAAVGVGLASPPIIAMMFLVSGETEVATCAVGAFPAAAPSDESDFLEVNQNAPAAMAIKASEEQETITWVRMLEAAAGSCACTGELP